jgi:glycine cleavage system H lipoate-binding protein
METSGYVDIFATKGAEYILIFGFLIALVFFWRFLNRSRRSTHSSAPPVGDSSALQFEMKQRYFYHQGHSWALPEQQNVVRVGIDDFAQRLIGLASIVELPKVGASLEQGGKGWILGVDSKTTDIISPVSGEVIAVNDEALRNPRILNQDPYGRGWLIKVRVPSVSNNIRNLLSGELAAAWMKNAAAALCLKMADDPQLLTRGNGSAATGNAEDLSQNRWKEIAREFFLSR